MTVPVGRRGTWTPPRVWELLFAVAFVGVLSLSLFTESTGQVATATLLVLMLGWYLVLGRRAVLMQCASWHGYVFEAGVLVLFAAALSQSSSVSYLLFALSPMAYMTIPGRQAHVVVITLAFLPAGIFLARTGDVWLTVRVLVPIGVVVTTISIVMSVTIGRIERLIGDLESSRAEVARLSREAGVAEERQRLASDIHDTIAQGLSSVVMLIEAAARAEPEQARAHLNLAAKTALENLNEARAIVGALQPTQLTGVSLVDALRRVTERFAQAEIPGTFTVAGTAPATVPTPVEVVLLRVVQEALTNARKHSRAQHVAVHLTYGPSSVAVEVVDDGSGFDVEGIHSGYGLGSMRARVEQVGGRLVISSTPTAGTTVWAEVAV
jgi:signal transduction histidine kinase